MLESLAYAAKPLKSIDGLIVAAGTGVDSGLLDFRTKVSFLQHYLVP
ncbi:MAG: hypothetical protein IPI79_14190 [Moraxellaceae bacterium]|nr:hypothetical protein [Moraxellaceae bacterium]